MNDVHAFPAFLGLAAPLADNLGSSYGNHDVMQAL
jgi:hypothetical protein